MDELLDWVTHQIYTRTDPHTWGPDLLQIAHDQDLRIDQVIMEVARRLYDQMNYDEVEDAARAERRAMLRVVRDGE
jgi:hypothetical protein